MPIDSRRPPRQASDVALVTVAARRRGAHTVMEDRPVCLARRADVDDVRVPAVTALTATVTRLAAGKSGCAAMARAPVAAPRRHDGMSSAAMGDSMAVMLLRARDVGGGDGAGGRADEPRLSWRPTPPFTVAPA
jgi:hypothetical protein